MPSVRHDMDYWGRLANKEQDRKSKKRKICDDDDGRIDAIDPSLAAAVAAKGTLGISRALNEEGVDSAVLSAVAEEEEEAPQSTTQQMRRSPSNSMNSDTTFSVASTHGVSFDLEVRERTLKHQFDNKQAVVSSNASYINVGKKTVGARVSAAAAAAPVSRKPSQSRRHLVDWRDGERTEVEAPGPHTGPIISNSFA